MEVKNRILVILFLIITVIGFIFFTDDDFKVPKEPIFDIIREKRELKQEVDTLKIEVDSLENQIDTLNIEVDRLRKYSL